MQGYSALHPGCCQLLACTAPNTRPLINCLLTYRWMHVGKCEGACGSDANCAGSLKCFKSGTSSNAVRQIAKRSCDVTIDNVISANYDTGISFCYDEQAVQGKTWIKP